MKSAPKIIMGSANSELNLRVGTMVNVLQHINNSNQLSSTRFVLQTSTTARHNNCHQNSPSSEIKTWSTLLLEKGKGWSRRREPERRMHGQAKVVVLLLLSRKNQEQLYRSNSNTSLRLVLPIRRHLRCFQCIFWHYPYPSCQVMVASPCPLPCMYLSCRLPG